MIHCYVAPESIQDRDKQEEIGRFCRKMGRETNQGEIGVIVGDEYIAVTDYEED